MKNKHNYDLRDLLEDKGIFSSGKSRSAHSTKNNAGSILNSLFKEVMKDINTDPEIKRRRKAAKAAENPRTYDLDDLIFADEDKYEEIKQRSATNAEKKKHEAEETANRQRQAEESARREAARKKLEAEKTRKQEEQLLKEKKDLEAKIKNNHNIARLLRNRTTLRQAIVLSEIIARPPGMY